MGYIVFLFIVLVLFVLWVFFIVAMWTVFEKANQPGWAAIVPFYNIYVLLKVVGRPGWWLALMFVPGVVTVIAIVVMIDLAKAFGKRGVFAVLLILLPFVGWPILAFGEVRYVGPVADPAFRAGAYGQPGYPQPGYPQQSGQYPPGYPQPGYQQQSGYPQQGQPQGYPQQPEYPPQDYPPSR